MSSQRKHTMRFSYSIHICTCWHSPVALISQVSPLRSRSKRILKQTNHTLPQANQLVYQIPEKTEYWGDRWGMLCFGERKATDRSAEPGLSLPATVLEQIWGYSVSSRSSRGSSAQCWTRNYCLRLRSFTYICISEENCSLSIYG